MSAFHDLPDEITLSKDQLGKIVSMTIAACWDAVRWDEGVDTGVLWIQVKRFLEEPTEPKTDPERI